MFTASTPYIVTLYGNLDKILLIFARMGGFIYLIPIFSGQTIPRQVKVGFIFMTSMLIFMSGIADTSIEVTNAIQFAVLICKEIITGLILSFVVYLIFTTVYFAGQIMDYNIGFSMVNVLDPVSQIQVPITGNIIYYVISVLLIITGGLNSLLGSLFETYKKIPIGGANLSVDEGLLQYMIQLTSNYFELGLRISAPILVTILVVDVSLGVLVKASPQMNVFVVGMPIKLLVGLTVLFIVCPYFIEVYNELFITIFNAVNKIIGGMTY